MDRPIPIILLTGFLGAGKTTLLNQLLQAPEIASHDLALVVNEFGQVGIDGTLINPGHHPLFELNKGSLFCICIKTDLIRTLTAIADEVRPALVLVEATGVAEPCDLEQLLDTAGLQGRFRIQAALCLVDAAQFVQVAPMVRAVRRQVEWADGIVINKTDKVTPASLKITQAILREINPDAPQVTTTQGRLPSGWLQRLRHVERGGMPFEAPPEPLVSISLRSTGAVSREAFFTALGAVFDRVLRLKGYIDFGTGPVYLEQIGDDLTERPAPERPAGETALVVIGWHVTAAVLRQTFVRVLGSAAPVPEAACSG